MKKFFGAYGWSVLLGIFGGIAMVKGSKNLMTLMLLIAMILAVVAEYKTEQTTIRKAIGMMLALILSPAVYSLFAGMAQALISGQH